MKSDLHICIDINIDGKYENFYYIYINHEHKFWFWGEAHMEYNEYHDIKLNDFIVYESGLNEWDAGLWREFYNEVLPPSSYLTITDKSLTYYLMHSEEQMKQIIQTKIDKGEYKYHKIVE